MFLGDLPANLMESELMINLLEEKISPVKKALLLFGNDLSWRIFDDDLAGLFFLFLVESFDVSFCPFEGILTV